MVDANGAYRIGQARRVGAELDSRGVCWFEEPVSSDDTAGLASVRAACGADVTAGEYISDVYDAADLAPVVSCLQLDATRCGGYTGFLRCAAVAAANNLDVSCHCAPALHAPVAAALPHLRHRMVHRPCSARTAPRRWNTVREEGRCTSPSVRRPRHDPAGGAEDYLVSRSPA